MLFSKYSLICSGCPLFSTVIVRICQDTQSPSQLAETGNFHWLIFLFVCFSDYHLFKKGPFPQYWEKKPHLFKTSPSPKPVSKHQSQKWYIFQRKKKKRFWLNILQARRRESEMHYKLERCSLGFNVSHSYITWWSVSIAQTGPKIHV